MSRKKLVVILIIILALIILIGLVYFMFLAPVQEEPAVDVTTNNEVAEKLPEMPSAPLITPPTQRRPAVTEPRNTTKDELKRVAASFVERYGSYSNQSGHANLRELNVFMTNSLQQWIQNYINEAQKQNIDTNIYYGMTTQAVVVEEISYDEANGRAEFLVKTQRKESVGTSVNSRKFQQNAEIHLLKVSGIWKVDWISWVE